MKNSRFCLSLIPVAVTVAIATVASLIGGCGSSQSATHTYASTSTKGDFAQWTISGGAVNATWQVTDSSGAVAKTLTVSASCGAPDATFGYSSCTIGSASCADGTQVCGGTDAPAPGSTFNLFEVPGTALFVQASGGGSSQLHVGFALDTSCSGVAGDYSFLHLGNDQTDLFGLYRTDATMSSITHADFRMTSASLCTNSTNSGNCTANDQTVAYSTGGGTGTGVETISSNSCSSGVRTLGLASGTVRAMQSQSGVFMIDLPSGNGGIVAFKTTSAAQLSDFANISFGGITFPDNGGPKLIAGSTGAVSGSNVPITNLQFSGGGPSSITNPVITAATNTTSTATSPAYPNFTTAPTGTYGNNTTLQLTYPNPSTIPGLFRIDGTFSDAGRVLMMATKYNGKILGFGTVYNWRNPTLDPTFSSLTHGVGYYNTGAFIMFQK